MRRADSGSASPLRDFLRTESSGGILLVVAAVVAIAWSNSPWSASYEKFWTKTISLGASTHTLDLVLRQCVNEGLITILFFVVGLEIKRELVDGRLATRRAAFLPIVAAVGGMALPAMIYLGIAGRTAPRGWAIVVATDIALAVGVVSIAGSRVSPGLRVFLLALAIIDDIGALLIIAVAYTSGLGWGWLAGAAAVVVASLLVRRAGARQVWLYVALGCLLWVMLRRAGLNPTLSGVAMGLVVPASTDVGSSSVVVRLEHLLHPWASYVIVPIFALANSGITLSTDLIHSAVRSPITWGIVAGRVIGKPLGIVAATKSMIGIGQADQPDESTDRQLLGVAASAGMGFTVALFITELAFTDPVQRSDATLGILIAAVVAGTLSLTILTTDREPRGRSERQAVDASE